MRSSSKTTANQRFYVELYHLGHALGMGDKSLVRHLLFVSRGRRGQLSSISPANRRSWAYQCWRTQELRPSSVPSREFAAAFAGILHKSIFAAKETSAYRRGCAQTFVDTGAFEVICCSSGLGLPGA